MSVQSSVHHHTGSQLRSKITPYPPSLSTVLPVVYSVPGFHDLAVSTGHRGSAEVLSSIALSSRGWLYSASQKYVSYNAVDCGSMTGNQSSGSTGKVSHIGNARVQG